LIVEDDSMTALILSEFLSSHGYRTTVTTNGFEAVSWFKELEPDLALVDILLPRKNGFQVCYEMKGCEHGQVTPVVLMSAVYRDVYDGEARALRVRAEGFLVKPFDLEELLTRVQELVGDP
jgi:DNA-binding response OmpR family regulator